MNSHSCKEHRTGKETTNPLPLSLLVVNNYFTIASSLHHYITHDVDMIQVLLPDMELIVNLGDWPLNKKNRQPPFPVFSWCGSEDTRDIIWPTWDLMKATIMGMDRWVLGVVHHCH